MALRMRRFTVRDAADMAAGQTGVRTRAVKCRGAVAVQWVGFATNANALTAVQNFASEDPAIDAPTGNFADIAGNAYATVAASGVALGAMNAGGRLLAAISHEAGGRIPLAIEQAELRFNSHGTLTITGLRIEAIVIDDVSIDHRDDAVRATTT